MPSLQSQQIQQVIENCRFGMGIAVYMVMYFSFNIAIGAPCHSCAHSFSLEGHYANLSKVNQVVQSDFEGQSILHKRQKIRLDIQKRLTQLDDSLYLKPSLQIGGIITGFQACIICPIGALSIGPYHGLKQKLFRFIGGLNYE